MNETLVDKAINFLEIRHKLVHTDGKVDEDFRKQHDDLSYTEKNYLKQILFFHIQKQNKSEFAFILLCESGRYN